MEDGKYLSDDDKSKLESLKKELVALKRVHKNFAAKKGGVTPEERELWRLNSMRTNQVYIEIKEIRFKNVIEAAKG